MHPKLVVGHLPGRIAQIHLQNRVLMTAKLRSEDNFLNNYEEFVRELGTKTLKDDSNVLLVHLVASPSLQRILSEILLHTRAFLVQLRYM